MIRFLLVLFAVLTTTSFAQKPPELVGPYPLLYVVDGDTIRISLDGKPEYVRLTGVNTPEVRGGAFYATEATAFTRSLLEGQEVRLEYDSGLRDRYNRVLAYVYLSDGSQLNLLLAEGGFATAYYVPPNERYKPLYVAAVAGAKSVHKGMWQTLTGAFRDRNCTDFRTQAEAQAFFMGAKTALRDPHGLDRDADGIACASLKRGN